MSAKARILWIYPAIVVASWLVVRSLAASPDAPLDDPPVSMTTTQTEVRDVSLARLIARFAEVARADRSERR
jgi:hypothetical protein